jgi:Flp pilus assembly pilin Flp
MGVNFMLLMDSSGESGQALVEYALIVAAIATVCVFVVQQFGQFILDSLFTPIIGSF